MNVRLRSLALVAGAALVSSSPVRAFAPAPRAAIEERSPRTSVLLDGRKPWRDFVAEDLARATRAESEAFVQVDARRVLDFVRTSERSAYHASAFVGGEAGLSKTLAALDGEKLAATALAGSPELATALEPNLVGWAKRDAHELARWKTTVANLVVLGSGRGVEIRLAADAGATWIPCSATDGAVFVRAPGHAVGPANVARWLDAIGAMPASDDARFWPFVLEVLVRGDGSRARELSPAGRSVAAEWMALNAAESLRDLESWGPDVTRALLTARVVRALGGRVFVPRGDGSGRWELRSASPAFFHDLGANADLADRPEMLELRKLADFQMREAHPEVVKALEDQFFIPEEERSIEGRSDTIGALVDHLYHSEAARRLNAERVVRAASDYFEKLGEEGPRIVAFFSKPLTPRE